MNSSSETCHFYGHDSFAKSKSGQFDAHTMGSISGPSDRRSGEIPGPICKRSWQHHFEGFSTATADLYQIKIPQIWKIHFEWGSHLPENTNKKTCYQKKKDISTFSSHILFPPIFIKVEGISGCLNKSSLLLSKLRPKSWLAHPNF